MKLIAFTPDLLADKYALSILRNWRNAALHTFANSTPVTVESTHRWLTSVFNDPYKQLWWVHSNTILKGVEGHIGIVFHKGAKTELGYVMRGVSPGTPGLMSAAVQFLCNIHKPLVLKVLNDNARAIFFYTKLNFRPVGEETPHLIMEHS